ncbi:hypothetical protein [Ligilactobacillus ruminis]|uniref:Endonuclease n=3 Tax=Ligilactobacillus ruminis TaxID=1623 RepID=G2SRD8_LIGR2|nr:hypothetical protein [Ligilactobacillus ruminis]MCR5749638.1 hypothetical protein [Lactobacillus sp.]AEN77683.1 Hypothetical protein LRC_03660 [Ligilactobacillus ruminis ATCC 27782]KLA47423.1 hypothetical protein LRB_78 [Ligilactobacillus ruminis]KRM82237.1 hypothetical protein FC25_GL001057 [Ligilactobacillus ruminis DSM 20403 = NBRC 102161]SFG52077.1 Endonuclease/Exonuclease/phosphatase family protein [Ligilactobacillus ruminis DSM 20403 = NBRC 102161]
MYLRIKAQQRTLDNLQVITKNNYPDLRVTKGYVLTALLEGYKQYVNNEEVLKKAIKESDVKQEGSGTPVNFNITAQANTNLESMKRIIDKMTGRSFFPAQIIDILLICALSIESKDFMETEDSIDSIRLQIIKKIADTDTTDVMTLYKIRKVLNESFERGCNMMKYKVLEHNVNQATNKDGKNSLPAVIVTEIHEEKPDLGSLPEFAFCKNYMQFFDDAFGDEYDYYPKEPTANTDNKQNELLLFWKKEKFEAVLDSAQTTEVTWENNMPNFTSVILKEKDTEKEFLFCGLRITMARCIDNNASKAEQQKQYKQQAALRREQMEYVLSVTDKCEHVLIVGDFNNYRRGVDLEEWNVGCINCGKQDYTVYTPNGQSIYKEDAMSDDYEFPEDHIVSRGIEVSNYRYDRKFIKWDTSGIYKKAGTDFSDWSYLHGYPDHATLIAEFELS